MKRIKGIDKYSTFGLRGEWLEEFLDFGDVWLENNSLPPKQKVAAFNWLNEAGLIDYKTKSITKLGKDLKIIYETDSNFVWGVIWCNLYYNSKIVNWYCDNIDWGMKVSRENLLENLLMSFPDLSKGTLNNASSALINMFDLSPLNDDFNLGILEKKGRSIKYINKKGVDYEMDILLVAYSLYKIKQYDSRVDVTVSEVYGKNFEGGPYKLFGISRLALERTLRGLKYFNNLHIIYDDGSNLNSIRLNEEISLDDLIKYKKELCLSTL